MTDTTVLFGSIAVVIGIIGYIPYYRDIFKNKTRPHPFTWTGFALLNGITFAAQLISNAGPGAWVSGVTTLATSGIAFLAYAKGDKNITSFDWICFTGALLGIGMWKLTNDPLQAVIIVTIADLLSFAPTFRKAYARPHEETVTLYTLSVLKYAISLWALTSVTLTTALFPAAIALFNAAIVLLIMFRRF